MSHFDPSASVSSFASDNTIKGTATPDASTANLIPPDGQSSTNSPNPTSTSTSSSSRATTSRKPPTTAPRSQTYPTSSNAPPKDYEQAFATLSSAWGFGASVPAKNPKSAKERADKKEKKDKKEKQRKKKKKDERNLKASESTGDSESASPVVPSSTLAGSGGQGSASPSELGSSSTSRSTLSRRG